MDLNVGGNNQKKSGILRTLAPLQCPRGEFRLKLFGVPAFVR